MRRFFPSRRAELDPGSKTNELVKYPDFAYNPFCMANQKRDLLFWAPRILSILFILFLAMFSLDVFESGYGFWDTLFALFMHNIPSLILTIAVIISWKREMVGAITFALAGLAYVVLITGSSIASGRFEPYMITWPFIISGPAFVVSFLFYLNWRNKRKS